MVWEYFKWSFHLILYLDADSLVSDNGVLNDYFTRELTKL